jgi:predicted nucleic acid-binding protein
VRVVVTDTSPINYLVLTNEIELLPRLFERVILPSVVEDELSSMGAPAAVRAWIATPPSWLEIIHSEHITPFAGLHWGESTAIAVAQALQADLLLMDERKGVKVARERGLNVTGILGIFELAARRGLIDLTTAFEQLRRTNFRAPAGVMESLLKRYPRRDLPSTR